jgi:spore coat polysaccharide biosynthesis protein SpsF
MTDVACIIQARCNSYRLMGKILMPLKGEPAIAHVVKRARAIPGVDLVICATPDTPDNDPVTPVAEAAGARVCRGSEHDVLARYHAAAVAFAPSAAYVMRVTGDCPLLDPEVCGELLRKVREADADYGATALWPHGLDCEVFTHALLERARAEATSPGDREHVTLWMKRQADIRRVVHTPERDYHAENRWVLDYPEDYAFLEALFAKLPDDGTIPSWRDVLAIVDANPELRAINRDQAEAWRAETAKIYDNAKDAKDSYR